MLKTGLAGEPAALHASGAVFLPTQRTVLVADAHFGKAVSYRRCHYPKPIAGAYVLAGHWHPCVSVRGRAFERLRLPCFWFGDDTGALPPG